MTKIAYSFMDEKGIRTVHLTPKEYDEILNKIYDKEKVLTYIEEDLINWGVCEVDSYMLVVRANRDESVYKALNLFMKEVDHNKKTTLLSEILTKVQYEPKRS